ncbi:MAG: 50S ribosomal protein L25 [Candidatus Omnitrophica bacterium]|nr:50S ribosomal protein L25 [Candidatus Omnitrophota bacterium]
MAQQTEKITLNADVRKKVGTSGSRDLRREGKIPGILYGEGGVLVPIGVQRKDLQQVLHTKAGENVLISLKIKGDTKAPESVVLIKELQHHPVTHDILHVDFYRVSLTKKIHVTVPLSFKGEAPGVKVGGGVLEHLRWEVEVECLPTDIPNEIPVDISGLELNKHIEAKDMLVPAGVKLMLEPETPIIGCVLPKLEEVSAAVEGEPAEPEVITEKKPEEGVEQPPAGEKGKEEKAVSKKEEKPAKEEKK